MPLWAQDGYVSLGTDADGAWSFHRASVGERADEWNPWTNVIAGWVQIVYSDTGATKAYRSRRPYRGVFLYTAKKDLKQVKVMSTTHYDKEGLEIYSSPYASGWQECPLGSMNEKIWQALMQAAGIRY